MGFTDSNHRYEAVNDNEDGREGLLEKSQPQQRTSGTEVVVAWWKIVLLNVLAAGLGAGAMYFVYGGFDAKSESHGHGNAEATGVTAAFISSAAPSSTTASAAILIKPTPSIEYVDKHVFPNELDGIILDCGHSPEAAREKGCIYDVMMQDWVPEPCYDEVLTKRYLDKGNYTWYADGEGKTTISNEVMALGEHGRAWMSTKYHKDHCVFSWLKIIRALRMKRGISQELLSYDHVLHCSHGALKEDDDNTDLGVSAPTNYAKCALYETWKQDFIPDKHDSGSK